MVLATLAALALSTHVFVTVKSLRAIVVRTPAPATAGLLRRTIAGLPQVNRLRPPFALVAQITSASTGTRQFSIAIDGTRVCERSVPGGGSRRIDCAVSAGWNWTIDHTLVIQGPPTAWTLDYLELASEHGSNGGAHSMVVLPAGSHRYVRPGTGWVIATWLMVVAALVLLPAAPPLPRWIRAAYGLVVGAVVLDLALVQFSQWASDYRIVLSADTFARLLLLVFVPRLLVACWVLARTGVPYPKARAAARRGVGLSLALILLCASGAAVWGLFLKSPWEQFQQLQARWRAERARVRLFAELQPVRLGNCEFQRFGEPNDGGYLLCANLLGSVRSAYSYGISGYDEWGCDVTRRLSVPVHQYDCFDSTRPACAGGQTVFHDECVAGEPATIEGRRFDTPWNQFVKNGDGAKRLLVKMDVEGAEWDTLLRAPDPVFNQIDQFVVEFHGVQEPERSTAVVEKLKRFFYVAYVHFNNFNCMGGHRAVSIRHVRDPVRQQKARRAWRVGAGWPSSCPAGAQQSQVEGLPDPCGPSLGTSSGSLDADGPRGAH